MTGGRGLGVLHALCGKGTWERQNGRKELLLFLEGKMSCDLGPCIS